MTNFWKASINCWELILNRQSLYRSSWHFFFEIEKNWWRECSFTQENCTLISLRQLNKQHWFAFRLIKCHSNETISTEFFLQFFFRSFIFLLNWEIFYCLFYFPFYFFSEDLVHKLRATSLNVVILPLRLSQQAIKGKWDKENDIKKCKNSRDGHFNSILYKSNQSVEMGSDEHLKCQTLWANIINLKCFSKNEDETHGVNDELCVRVCLFMWVGNIYWHGLILIFVDIDAMHYIVL